MSTKEIVLHKLIEEMDSRQFDVVNVFVRSLMGKDAVKAVEENICTTSSKTAS